MDAVMVPCRSTAENDRSQPDDHLEYARNWKLAEDAVFSRTLQSMEHGVR